MEPVRPVSHIQEYIKMEENAFMILVSRDKSLLLMEPVRIAVLIPESHLTRKVVFLLHATTEKRK
jgi:hypothetical protein